MHIGSKLVKEIKCSKCTCNLFLLTVYSHPLIQHVDTAEVGNAWFAGLVVSPDEKGDPRSGLRISFSYMLYVVLLMA